MLLLLVEDLGLNELYICHRAARLYIFEPVCRFEFVRLIGFAMLLWVGVVTLLSLIRCLYRLL